MLRVLLRAAPLRLGASCEVVRLSQVGALHGKLGLLCLSEVRLAILRHWESTSGAVPTEDSFDDLLLLSRSVLSALLPDARHSYPMRGVTRECSIGTGRSTLAATQALNDVSTPDWGRGEQASQPLRVRRPHNFLPSRLHGGCAASAGSSACARCRPRIARSFETWLCCTRRPPELTPHCRLVEPNMATAVPFPPHLSRDLLHIHMRQRRSPHRARYTIPVLSAIEGMALVPSQRRVLRSHLSWILRLLVTHSSNASHAPQHHSGQASPGSTHISSDAGPSGAELNFAQFRILDLASHLIVYTDSSGSVPSCESRIDSVVGGDAHCTGCETFEWINLLMLLASATPSSDLPGLLWQIETSLRYSTNFYSSLIAHLVASTELAAGSAVGTADSLRAAHHRPSCCPAPVASLLVYLLLLQRGARPAKLLPALRAYICATAVAAASRGGVRGADGGNEPAHSSAGACMPARAWMAVQRLFRDLIALPALAARAELLVDVALYLCESSGAFYALGQHRLAGGPWSGAVSDEQGLRGSASSGAWCSGGLGFSTGALSWADAGGFFLLSLFERVAESRPLAYCQVESQGRITPPVRQ